MIRKICGVIVGVLMAGASYGIDMEFVTVLSSRVGSFASLETASENPVVVGKNGNTGQVNFCNTKAPSGTITLQGTGPINLGDIYLSEKGNTGLTGNISSYETQKILMNGGGTLQGRALLADKVDLTGTSSENPFTVYDATLQVAGTMSVDGTMSVQGAQADKLYLGSNGDQGYITQQLGGHVSTMRWSNQYQTTYDEHGNPPQYTVILTGQPAHTYLWNQYLLKGRRLGRGSDIVGTVVDGTTFFGMTTCPSTPVDMTVTGAFNQVTVSCGNN